MQFEEILSSSREKYGEWSAVTATGQLPIHKSQCERKLAMHFGVIVYKRCEKHYSLQRGKQSYNLALLFMFI